MGDLNNKSKFEDELEDDISEFIELFKDLVNLPLLPEFDDNEERIEDLEKKLKKQQNSNS